MRILLWLAGALGVFLSILKAPYTIISAVREAHSKVSKEQALGEWNELLGKGAISQEEYDKAKRDLYCMPAKNIALHQQILARICSIRHLEKEIQKEAEYQVINEEYHPNGIDSNILIIDRMKNKIKNITETLNDLADGEFFHYYNNDWYVNEEPPEPNPLSPENRPLGWGVEGEGSQVCVNIATFNESKLDDVMFAITHNHGERRYPSLPEGVLGSLYSADERVANVSLETSQIEETVKNLTEELQSAQAKNKQIIAENEELEKEIKLVQKLNLDLQKKQKRSDLAKKKGVKGVTNFMNHVAKPHYKKYCEKTIKNQSINGAEHLEEFLTDKECMKNIEDDMKYTMEEKKINMEMPKKPEDKKPWENSAWIKMQREVLEELGIKKTGQSSKRK